MQNIQRCFTGTGARGLDFISPSLNCINTKLTQIGEDFCGLDVNTPLGGKYFWTTLGCFWSILSTFGQFLNHLKSIFGSYCIF